MAEVAKATAFVPSPCSTNPSPDQFPTYKAGEAIGPGDNCYVDGTGQARLGNGTTLNAAATRVRGQAAAAASVGESVTLTRGLRFNYAAGTLTPGADLYLSAAVPGGLSTTATTGGTVPIAFAVDTNRVEFLYAN
jgi:hypothetical protein